MTAPAPLPPIGISVAVALLGGVSVTQGLQTLPRAGACAVLIAVALSLFVQRDWRRAAGAFLFGVAWAALFGQHVISQRLTAELSGGDFLVEGRVVGLPQRFDESSRFDLLVLSGSPGSPVGRKVRIGWYGAEAPLMQPGSRWRMTVRLKRPRGVLNPGGYDFERAALVQRIAATGSVREPRSARKLENGRGMDFLRDRLSQSIAAALPEGRARFVQALALGDTRALVPADWEILRATGLTHQIAISGFHVGMVAGFGALLLQGLFRLCPSLGRVLPRPQAAALGALAFALGYTALAGFALPTVRTLLMIGVVLVARLFRRAQSSRESYALAVVAVLVFDPLCVLAPGFWLSFIGVGWLLWCLPSNRDESRVRPFLQAQGVAVLGLLPLTVWFFGQASVPGPVANLIGIPMISLAVVPLALAGLLVHPVWPEASAIAWSASAWVMDRLWSVLEWVSRWDQAMLWLPEASLLALALSLIAAFWLLLPRVVPGKTLAVALFLPLLWPDSRLPSDGQADIDVIDVGQGLSVLVRTANHRMLLDAGPASSRGLDFGEAAVVPALHALGVRSIDSLLISHGDNDHSGGMGAVLRAFPGARVLGVAGWAKPGMGLCEGPQSWQWDGVEFEILHPPAFFPYLRNDSSCVLRIAAGGSVALLPGDIGRHVETRLLREQGTRLAADLLVVPHHGSASSSSQQFIQAVHPKWAVVSAGAGNRFKLPKQAIIERYQSSGATVLNTADTGALGFRLGAGGAELRSARRQDQPRYWREPPAAGSGYATGNRTGDR